MMLGGSGRMQVLWSPPLLAQKAAREMGHPADSENKPVIAAVNRCATQNQF
jgi:hypothetical protein